MARVHVMALCAAASALRPTARRTALRLGTASIIQIALPALADTEIDMDKIRALAAKKGSMDMSLPGLGKDPSKEKALVDVVLGANGARRGQRECCGGARRLGGAFLGDEWRLSGRGVL